MPEGATPGDTGAGLIAPDIVGTATAGFPFMPSAAFAVRGPNCALIAFSCA